MAGALTVVAVYFIAARMYGRGVGLGAASILALLPSHMYWSSVLFPNVFFTMLFAACFAVLLHISDLKWSARSVAVVVGFGAMIGVTAVVRGEALLLLGLAALLWLLQKHRAKQVAIAILGTATVAFTLVLPWGARNWVHFQAPILLSANFGYDLRIGHAPYTTGRYIVPQDLVQGPRGTLQ
jgi:4-amino-4-deoxy-L-arabinose transferase-like glycosyltransferase